MKVQDNIIVKKDAPFLVRFEPTLKDAVLRRAKREGMSAAAIIRMALRAFLYK
jgi:hypothetical protein